MMEQMVQCAAAAVQLSSYKDKGAQALLVLLFMTCVSAHALGVKACPLGCGMGAVLPMPAALAGEIAAESTFPHKK